MSSVTLAEASRAEMEHWGFCTLGDHLQIVDSPRYVRGFQGFLFEGSSTSSSQNGVR